jgi:predicted O-methyltransferase YrrM
MTASIARRICRRPDKLDQRRTTGSMLAAVFARSSPSAAIDLNCRESPLLPKFNFSRGAGWCTLDLVTTTTAGYGKRMDSKIQGVLDAYHEMIDKERGSPRMEAPGGRDGGQDTRMRAVGPRTGQLLNILAASLPSPTILELGTSFGYSGIWLAEAARASGGRLITMELHGYKSEFARDMATRAGLADVIDFRVGDAVEMIKQLNVGIDFILVDLWKDLYLPCLEAFYPKLNPGAIIVADNMLRPGDDNVKAYGEAIRRKPGISSVLLPVGSGIEISRYEP